MARLYLISTLILGLFGGIFGFYMYQKPVESSKSIKADFAFSDAELASKFAENPIEAEKEFKNKVLQISGRLSNISNNQQIVSAEFIASENVILSMSFESDVSFPELIDGASIAVKGKYAGFIEEDLDFEIPGEIKLNACVIVKD